MSHTFATQLGNAGCDVTSIQQLLGHRRVNTTMIYTLIHDATVAADYLQAMGRIEEKLQLVDEPAIDEVNQEPLVEIERMLAILETLKRSPLDALQRPAIEELTVAFSHIQS